MYKRGTRSTRAQGLRMNLPPHTASSRSPDSLELHVPTEGLVCLALKVHLAQARGTLLMGREVYACHA